VHSTLGVSRVVRFGTRYTVVPDHVIHSLRARADRGSGLHRLSAAAPLVPGAAVRIRTGPFDGLDGVFEREAGNDRVVVLLSLLGQYASVCVPVNSVFLSATA
jgi:transcriptional antiterminator RfaH